jgi:hypothetical protein
MFMSELKEHLFIYWILIVAQMRGTIENVFSFFYCYDFLNHFLFITNKKIWISYIMLKIFNFHFIKFSTHFI